MILAGTERAYRKVTYKLSAVYLQGSDCSNLGKLEEFGMGAPITVECRQNPIVNSKIFKPSLNHSLMHYRAHVVCYEQKKILRYIKLKHLYLHAGYQILICSFSSC